MASNTSPDAPPRVIAPSDVVDVAPKTAGDRLETALVDAVGALESVDDTTAEWYDARTRERFSPAVPLLDVLEVPVDTPVEVKACRVTVSNGSGSTKGRFYLKRKSHRQLVDADGVYLLAVYDPDADDDADAVRAMVFVAATGVDRVVDTWTDAEVGGADAEVAKLRWDRLLDPRNLRPPLGGANNGE